MLVVIDGAKALYKGVREIFGERALPQRCRVHKLHNGVEHLPPQKRITGIGRFPWVGIQFDSRPPGGSGPK